METHSQPTANKTSILRITFLLGFIALIIVGTGWGYYRHMFPYGRTHRCSGCLGMELTRWAHENGGASPAFDQPGSLGLSEYLNQFPDSLGMVVGKAEDLKEAERFYREHGYLKPEHSSWPYVSGLTTADEGKALLWDKIPLNHNGRRTSRNTREVIMVDGWLENVPEDQWQKFLDAQLSNDKK